MPSAPMTTSLQPSGPGPPSEVAHRTSPSSVTATITQSQDPALVRVTSPNDTVPSKMPVPTAPSSSAAMSKRLSSPGPPNCSTHRTLPSASKRAIGMSALPRLRSSSPPRVVERSNLPVT